MRTLFFLLLLGNVVFYLWATNIAPQPDGTKYKVDKSIPSFVLLHEQEAETDKPVAPAKLHKELPLSRGKDSVSNVAEVVSQQVCYSLGPLQERAVVEELVSWSKSRDFKAQVLSEDSKESLGFWVLYPAAKTMAESRANVKMLKEKGVEDYWLFRKGEHIRAISLGLFKERKRADAVKAKWAKEGVNLEVKQRFINQELFLVKLTTDTVLSARDVNFLVSKMEGENKVNQDACD